MSDFVRYEVARLMSDFVRYEVVPHPSGKGLAIFNRALPGFVINCGKARPTTDDEVRAECDALNKEDRAERHRAKQAAGLG